MKNINWSQVKGYALHAAMVAVIFLDPAIKHWLGGHPAYDAAGAMAWGFLLHWANGKIGK